MEYTTDCQASSIYALCLFIPSHCHSTFLTISHSLHLQLFLILFMIIHITHYRHVPIGPNSQPNTQSSSIDNTWNILTWWAGLHKYFIVIVIIYAYPNPSTLFIINQNHNLQNHNIVNFYFILIPTHPIFSIFHHDPLRPLPVSTTPHH